MGPGLSLAQEGGPIDGLSKSSRKEKNQATEVLMDEIIKRFLRFELIIMIIFFIIILLLNGVRL